MLTAARLIVFSLSLITQLVLRAPLPARFQTLNTRLDANLHMARSRNPRLTLPARR